MKVCSRCKIEKDTSLFLTNGFRNGKRRYGAVCLNCRKPPMTCELCGETGLPRSRGRNRKSCDNCYPYIRKAENLVAIAKYRANKKDIEFSLSAEFIFKKLKEGCVKTGLQFTLEDNGSNYSNRSPTTPSVDKIDSKKGYTEDNVQIVCWAYNVAKQQFSDEEVFQFWQKVMDYHARAENQVTGSQSNLTDGEGVSASAAAPTSLQTP